MWPSAPAYVDIGSAGAGCSSVVASELRNGPDGPAGSGAANRMLIEGEVEQSVNARIVRGDSLATGLTVGNLYLDNRV